MSSAAQDYKEQIKRANRASITGNDAKSSMMNNNFDIFSSEDEEQQSSETDNYNSDSDEDKKRALSYIKNGSIGNLEPIEKSEFHELDQT